MLRTTYLGGVSNASGMVLGPLLGARSVVTVNDWHPEGPKGSGGGSPVNPPALTISSAESGAVLGRSAELDFARDRGEIEALTLADGNIAGLCGDKGGASVAVLGKLIPLDISSARSRVGVHDAADYEGLVHHAGSWIVLMTVNRQPEDSFERPERLELFLATFNGDGSLADVAGPVRTPGGAIHHDFGGDMALLPSGNLIIPGFSRSGFVIVDRQAVVRASQDLPTSRVEGAAWDSESCRLLLARECHGRGWSCFGNVDNSGVPLWTVSF